DREGRQGARRDPPATHRLAGRWSSPPQPRGARGARRGRCAAGAPGGGPLMADSALRVSDRGAAEMDLEERREAEAELAAALEGEPIAEPLAAEHLAAESPAEPEIKPFSSLVPAIIGAAMLMQTLSATVIANALPPMAVTLHEDPVRLNTLISVYLLSLAVFLPVSGWAADRFGAKRVFLIAIALYAASCAACGFATNLPELLLARVAEGAAG